MTGSRYIVGAAMGVASCCPPGSGSGSIGLLSLCNVARNAQSIVEGTVSIGDHATPRCLESMTALDISVSQNLYGSELNGTVEVSSLCWDTTCGLPASPAKRAGSGVAVLIKMGDGSLAIHPSGGFFRWDGQRFIGSGAYETGLDAGHFYDLLTATRTTVADCPRDPFEIPTN